MHNKIIQNINRKKQVSQGFVMFIVLLISWQSSAISNITFPLDESQIKLKQIVAHDKHTYQLKLEKNQFVAGNVLQKSADIEITIFNPDGKTLGKFDRFMHNKEPFHFTTTQNGIYQIHLKNTDEHKGKYSINLTYSDSLATTNKAKMQQMMVHFSATEPGAVIAVVQAGKIVFSKGYGLSNVEYNIPNGANTPFQLASASKPFTAFAIAMLAEQNKLSLEDDVRKYLNWMPNFDEVITLRHLLNHSSGLKDAYSLWEMSGGRHDDILSQQQILEFIKNQKKLDFKPGERFEYNNGGYALLAEVVSKVTKQKFSTWMKENVFKPLGMNSTQIMDNHQLIIKNRAYSYESIYLGLKNAILNKSYVGAVNVYSTANDLALWFKNYHILRVGSQNILDGIWQPSHFNNGKTKNYSFGYFIKNYKGLKQIIQGGSTLFFKTMTNYYPKIDSGIIVLANTPDVNVRSIALKTADIFFFDAMQSGNKANQPQIPGATVRKHTDTPIDEIILNQQKVKSLQDYVGTYYSEELTTTYKVVFEKDLLVLKYHRGVFPLNPQGQDQFKLNNDWYMDWDFIFERDKQDKVQRLNLNHTRAHKVQFERIE